MEKTSFIDFSSNFNDQLKIFTQKHVLYTLNDLPNKFLVMNDNIMFILLLPRFQTPRSLNFYYFTSFYLKEQQYFSYKILRSFTKNLIKLSHKKIITS